MEIIKTQSEFDTLPLSFKSFTEIRIVGQLRNISKTPKNSYVIISGSANIGSISGSANIGSISGSVNIKSISGSANIGSISGSVNIRYICGSVNIESIFDSVNIESISNSANIESISGSTNIESISDSVAIKYISGSVIIRYIFNSVTIKFISNSVTIKYISGSVSIEYITDFARIQSISDSATIKSISGSVSIENVFGSVITIGSVFGSAFIKTISGSVNIGSISDSAIINSASGFINIGSIIGNAIIRVLEEKVQILEAGQQSTIIYHNCKSKPKKSSKTTSIIYKTKAKFEWINFSKIYNIQVKNRIVILYKSVREDLTDHHTGKIKYKIGTIVTAPDWNPDPTLECGGGLHVSPSISDCKRFNNGRYLKCSVNVKDIVVHPKPLYPYKVRCKQLRVLEEVFD